MKTVELGRTGEQVSRLALGCMLMGTLTDEATAVSMLDHYLESDGSFLDTANGYMWWAAPGSLGGESESLLGRWLRKRSRREDVFLATKGAGMVWNQDGVWHDGQADWGVAIHQVEGASAATLRKAMDDSLRRLQTDYVDLYYVHVDDMAVPLEETLSTLASFVVQTRRSRGDEPLSRPGRRRAPGDLARELGNLNGEFEGEQGLGRMHHAMGRHDLALTHHRQALQYATELAQPTDQARAHDGLARAHRALGRDDLARHHWQQVLDILAGAGVDRAWDLETGVTDISAQLADLLGSP